MAITMMLMLFNVVHQTIYSHHVFRKMKTTVTEFEFLATITLFYRNLFTKFIPNITCVHLGHITRIVGICQSAEHRVCI